MARVSFFIAVFAFAVLCAGQTTFVERFIIDDFNLFQGQEVTVLLAKDLSLADQTTIVDERASTTADAGCNAKIVGCSRDMILSVRAGGQGRRFNAQIFPTGADDRALEFEGEWVVSNPKGGNSINYLQYDGGDTSGVLDTRGLGGIDFTQGGLARGIRLFLVSDLPTTFSIILNDMDGRQSTGKSEFTVLVGQKITSRAQIAKDLLFTSFQGNADLTRIGAVELQLPSTDAVDAFVREIAVFGLPNPSGSPTPAPSASQSPLPSASRTPAPTPSQTPSTSGPCITRCVCPSFTCALLFDNPNSLNDVDRNIRQDQIIFDDSDVAVPIPVPVPVPVPGSISVPSIPSFSNSGSSSDGLMLLASASFVVLAVLF